MNLQELRRDIGKRLETTSLSPRLFISRFKVGFDRPSVLYNDPTYLPLFYYLGKALPNTKNLLEIGFDLGLTSGCFMYGCPGLEHFMAFRKSGEYPTRRLGVSNIHTVLKRKFDLWVGNETDAEFVKLVLGRQWDCVLINDVNSDDKTHKAYLNLIWNQMIDGGIVVVDYTNHPPILESYNQFCKINNREPFILKTFRGTGLLQK